MPSSGAKYIFIRFWVILFLLFSDIFYHEQRPCIVRSANIVVFICYKEAYCAENLVIYLFSLILKFLDKYLKIFYLFFLVLKFIDKYLKIFHLFFLVLKFIDRFLKISYLFFLVLKFIDKYLKISYLFCLVFEFPDN